MTPESGGTPSTGGGGRTMGGGGGGTATPPVDPLFVIRWYPVLLRVRTATGTEKAPAPEAKPDPSAAPEGEKAEDLGTLRGLEIPRAAEDKPIFVYFHWPHEDGERGRRIVKFCSGPLDDPVFIRMTPLFNCVEVNTRDSEPRLVEEAKVRTTPAVLVCRPDGSIVWRSDESTLGGRALADALKGVLRTRFPAYWEGIEKQAAEQKKALAEARRLFAAKKTDEAMGTLYPILDSDVRFTDEWAQAVKIVREEEKKAAEASEKR
jgi:hypothetical protein